MPDDRPTTAQKPDTGQLAGPQTHAVAIGAGVQPFRSVLSERPTYKTYRQMLTDPTIALARMTVTAPILAGSWSYEAADEAADEQVEFIRQNADPRREFLLAAALRSLDYGWAAFEKVFEVEGGRLVLRRIKPLLHDITEVLIDQATGRFAGLLQRGRVVIPLEKSLLFTHNQEADDYYGKPRLENCRASWQSWQQADEAAGRYDRKVAGVIPVVHYPTHPAVIRDRDGRERPVHEVALELVNSICAGKGLAVPNEVPLADDRDGVGPERRRWIVELLEDKGSRQPGFIERLRYLDSLKMRGYLRPERIALEGQHGTLAEAGEHGDLALTDGDMIHQELVRVINWHLVDQLLELNFGRQARGSVWIAPAPLQDAKLLTARKIIDQWAATPDGREDLRLWLDMDAILDLVALPKSEQVIDATDEGEEVDPAELLRRQMPPSNQGQQS